MEKPMCRYCGGRFDGIHAGSDHDEDGHSWAKCRERAANDAVLVRALLGLKTYHSVPESVRVLFEQGRDEFEARRNLSTPSIEH